MLPVLAIVAMMRANPRVTRTELAKILDLGPNDITLEGFDDPSEEDEETGEDEAVALTTASTGTENTPVTPDLSGTQDLLTTSQEQQESLTT